MWCKKRAFTWHNTPTSSSQTPQSLQKRRTIQRKESFPTKSSAAIQGALMCTYNKPFEWLDSLDADISQAKRRTPEIMRKFRERESQIRQLRLDRIRAKEAKVKAKALEDRFELIGKIDKMGGLWKLRRKWREASNKWRKVQEGKEKVSSSRASNARSIIAAASSNSPSTIQKIGPSAKMSGNWMWSRSRSNWLN